MEEKQTHTHFVLISIVAIVAVVGIVAIVISMTKGNSLTSPSSLGTIDGSGGNIAGTATSTRLCDAGTMHCNGVNCGCVFTDIAGNTGLCTWRAGSGGMMDCSWGNFNTI